MKFLNAAPKSTGICRRHRFFSDGDRSKKTRRMSFLAISWKIKSKTGWVASWSDFLPWRVKASFSSDRPNFTSMSQSEDSVPATVVLPAQFCSKKHTVVRLNQQTNKPTTAGCVCRFPQNVHFQCRPEFLIITLTNHWLTLLAADETTWFLQNCLLIIFLFLLMQHEHRSLSCTSTIPVSSSSTSQRFNWTADCGEQWVQWTHWKEPVWEDHVIHLEVSIMKVMTWSLTLRWFWAAPPPSHHQQTQEEESMFLWTPTSISDSPSKEIKDDQTQEKFFQPSILQFGESVWTGASVFRSEQTGALPYESSFAGEHLLPGWTCCIFRDGLLPTWAGTSGPWSSFGLSVT